MLRRDFLTLTAAGLAGCQLQSSPSSAGLNEATPRSTLPELHDWQALEARVQGSLIFSNHPDYERLKNSANARYDQQRPAVIIDCQNISDVQQSLAFIRQFQLPFTLRGGGHSYSGQSSTQGVLLILNAMKNIKLHGEIAYIEAGATLGDIYATLSAQGRSIPGGSCVSVGIAGLVQGGGLGIVDRRFGLTCDALLAVEVITADGQYLKVDAEQHPDLFWALRGGGGGQFAAVVRFEFQTFATAPVHQIQARFLLEHATVVFKHWQQWAQTLPNEIWSQIAIWFNANPDWPVHLQLRLCSLGHGELLLQCWQQLAQQLKPWLISEQYKEFSYDDYMLSDCDGLEQAECKMPYQHERGQIQRYALAGSSDFFSHPLPAAAIETWRQQILRRQQQGEAGGLLISVLGGAIQAVPSDATAYPHRYASLCAQYFYSAPPEISATRLQQASSWLQQMRESMRTWSTGGAYVNYPDLQMPNWQQAYYGPHYPRLTRIKAQYDPKEFFRQSQGISPA